jgi:hypothetical protein
MTRTCFKCKRNIPKARLDVLPDTQTCVECSGVQKYVGAMSYVHKTAPTLIYVRPENAEAVKILQREYRRARN